MTQDKIRNIAIIAHVDHGKTTLVDQMLKQGGVYRENQAVVDRVMDSGDLERERGITILAKNTAVHYKDYKINIVDTPGHADFSGEVERILKMVDGVLLLVDAAEGPMPQTRFVLQKALELGHKVIVVVNKIDRPDARVHEVMDEVLELLLDLNATKSSSTPPPSSVPPAKARPPTAPTTRAPTLSRCLRRSSTISILPRAMKTARCRCSSPPSTTTSSSAGWASAASSAVRSTRTRRSSSAITTIRPSRRRKRSSRCMSSPASAAAPSSRPLPGEIVAFSGISDITIGRTLCDLETIEPLPFVKISDPTIEMTFSVNDSPFAGREGKYVTSRNLRDRLQRELLKDVSLHVTEMGTDAFNVAGRGEMHLSILIETMRREGMSSRSPRRTCSTRPSTASSASRSSA